MLWSKVVALTTILLAPAVTAQCCDCTLVHPGQCFDLSPCTPCCGKGDCNIFCCNCDGGCRAGGELKLQKNHPHQPYQLQVNDEECRGKAAAYDTNGDGHITFLEWLFNKDPQQKVDLNLMADHWLKYDIENKGYLTYEEAYHRKP